jgi:hypothetical protein
MKTLPKELIEPKTYYIKMGMTIFIGGVARIDYVAGPKPLRYTVFTSSQTPIVILPINDAEEVYSKVQKGFTDSSI